MKQKRVLVLLLLLGSVFGTTTWLVADDDDDDEHYRRGRETSIRALAPVEHPAWKEECGSCHMLYHPGLLPRRSWQKMMTGLSNHFGDDASLDPAVADDIARFLLVNSAEQGTSTRSRRIAQSIAPSDTPLRISETQYFVHKHDEISPTVFKRKAIGSAANCAACHKLPETGDFTEESVRIPR